MTEQEQLRGLSAGDRHQWSVLLALRTYKLMSAPLLQAAGVARDVRRIREACEVLYRKRLIAMLTAREINEHGVRDALYWLRPAGAVAIQSEFGGDLARTADRKIAVGTLTPHRLDIVRWHIALRAWASANGATVGNVVQDFDPRVSQLYKATGVLHSWGWFHPDALAKVTPADGVPRLLVLEMERGGMVADPSKFRRRKLPQLMKAIQSDELAARYQLPGPPLFQIVFQTDGMRETALASWPQPLATHWGRCYVKTLDEVTADFAGSWWQPGDRPRRDLFEGRATKST